MATEKQIAANRLNARKSTGPRTSQGKARAAGNALKHGLLAEPALLPGEDELEFREFIEERVRELRPVGALESDHAQLMAGQLWGLLKRFPRIEAALFTSDRARRDYEYAWDRLMQYRTSALERALQSAEGDNAEANDEIRHAAAMKELSAAAEATRSELSLLGSAFATAAASGDPFGKLMRYETAALNRLHRLRAEFDELQARRKALHDGDDEVEAASF